MFVDFICLVNKRIERLPPFIGRCPFPACRAPMSLQMVVRGLWKVLLARQTRDIHIFTSICIMYITVSVCAGMHRLRLLDEQFFPFPAPEFGRASVDRFRKRLAAPSSAFVYLLTVYTPHHGLFLLNTRPISLGILF